ncbi:hypothetical protein ORQ95_06490 [Leptospira kirschneri]|nr:hypothetical protein [Leptospira kirschneri]EJO70885.1 hypothetical protein LEP1GSC044_1883 [Leptospira kirschneri serovar Grippotyphosa str. RM52]EKQ82251.1 hypothetical protein LEP1GSC064_4097 [Leptospira kirschneri serovar Grippotyphosa str. Moskva]EKR06944.1 hypothetical protein LEP1GSC122_3621 [Leptospira kirschneri serovar Valbuzzi str. 200702274]EMK05755.1 hypothetical protein LEP1GSC176_3073 [Leptospira kirschneri str. MMD1493]OOV48846.1 hypothetical protein B1J94_09380 [Leptospira 
MILKKLLLTILLLNSLQTSGKSIEKGDTNIRRKCSRSIPSSLAKESSNFRLEIDKNIGFESLNIDQNTKLKIQNYGCTTYFVEFYFIIKETRIKSKAVSDFKKK